MNTRDKIQIGVSIALTVVVIGLLVFAIVQHETGNSGEPGLMSVCWQPDGQANVDLTVCSNPEEVRWQREDFPLRVRGPQDQHLTNAILAVNSQIGCNLLEYQESDGSSNFDILVSLNVPMDSGSDHPGGETRFRRDGFHRMKAYVNMFGNTHGSDVFAKSLLHELGHALGLGHDYWNGSIMREQQRSGLEFVRFSDNDRRLLQGLYCPVSTQ